MMMILEFIFKIQFITLYSIDGTGDTFNIETNVSRELKLRTNDTEH